jgi:hypothetical protein
MDSKKPAMTPVVNPIGIPRPTRKRPTVAQSGLNYYRSAKKAPFIVEEEETN